jgi:hypothetical protein
MGPTTLPSPVKLFGKSPAWLRYICCCSFCRVSLAVNPTEAIVVVLLRAKRPSKSSPGYESSTEEVVNISVAAFFLVFFFFLCPWPLNENMSFELIMDTNTHTLAHGSHIGALEKDSTKACS